MFSGKTAFMQCWGPLGVNLNKLGINFGQVEVNLGPHWAILVRTWDQFGPAWASLAPTWSQLGRLGAILAPTWVQLRTHLGQLCAKLSQLGPNLQQLGTNFGPGRPVRRPVNRNQTSQEALKTNIFSTFSVFKPSKPVLIHINIIFDVVGTHINRYDCPFRAYDAHLEGPIAPKPPRLEFAKKVQLVSDRPKKL